MKKFIFLFNYTSFAFLSGLAFLSELTAQIGVGTASSWGVYQQNLPPELTR